MYSLIIKNASINRVFLYGVSLRLLICFYFLLFPIVHQKYGVLNSFSYQYFADLNFYFKFFNIVNFESNYFHEISHIYINLLRFNYNVFLTNDVNFLNYRFPGPFFPFILYVTSYSSDFTFLLAILIFIVEIFTLRLWIIYFFNKIKIIYIIIFATLPIPMVIGGLHSSDVFFYLFSSVIFFIAIDHIKVNNLIFSTIILIFICIKPASIGVLVSLMIFYILYKRKNNLFKIFFTIFSLILSLFYYQTYFLVEKTIALKNDTVTEFINSNLTHSQSLEIFLYYPIKLLFLFGFHPSSSGIEVIYLSRCFFGLILLVGYIYSLKNYKKFSFYFLNLAIIPIVIFLYPAWRYIVPFSPILYFNFTQLIDYLISILKKNKI